LPPRGYSDTASIEIFGCKALISARKNIFGSCRFPRVHCIFWLPMKRQHRGLCNLVWGTIEPLRGALSLSLSLPPSLCRIWNRTHGIRDCISASLGASDLRGLVGKSGNLFPSYAALWLSAVSNYRSASHSQTPHLVSFW
jgi:hypothetical protein